MLKIFFLLFMVTCIPVAIAVARALLVYLLVSGNLPPFMVVHRMISGIDSFPMHGSAVFYSGGQFDEQRGHHHAHLQLRTGAGRMDEWRPGPCECGRHGNSL